MKNKKNFSIEPKLQEIANKAESFEIYMKEAQKNGFFDMMEIGQNWEYAHPRKKSFDLKDFNSQKAKVIVKKDKNKIYVEYIGDMKDERYYQKDKKRYMEWSFNENGIAKSFHESDGGISVVFDEEEGIGKVIYGNVVMNTNGSMKMTIGFNFRKGSPVTENDIYKVEVEHNEPSYRAEWWRKDKIIHIMYENTENDTVVRNVKIGNLYESLTEKIKFKNVQYIPIDDVLRMLNDRPTYDFVLEHIMDEYDVVEEKNFDLSSQTKKRKLTFWF